ncbi:hypothetical protein ACFFGQ_06815 [Rufibacter quisquiliarum]|uniref:hypothetical protein n=1 Tax=Rufibacter quisquiliarum TaxID=1549639 RepID=UPI0035EAEF35
MNGETLTIEEIKQKTMELLGTNDPEMVSYIDEEYLSGDFQEIQTDEKGIDVVHWYGHSMSYGHHSQHGSIYRFKAGNPPTNINNACGNGGWWCSFALWNHYGTDRRCGSAEYQRVLRFSNDGN